MEMEGVRMTEEFSIKLFKIDLIVWKFINIRSVRWTTNMFKIDLIVWKLALSI